MASADQLNAAIEALGVSTGDGPKMPREQALGALLFTVEQLAMFDADRLDAAAVRSGYGNMALMAGLAMRGERLASGGMVPAAEFTQENYQDAGFAFVRLLEHRLNVTRVDLQEMLPRGEEEGHLVSPVVSWLQAISALMRVVNVETPPRDVGKAAKAAKKHAAVARQQLEDVLKAVGAP
ncbi:hypothetical protein [Streptomyces albidoflavus]|uniref:hypothetical protein n=1 Tax=Streptomyces albidoflavus TaxID=1886 RepID=UPI0010214041|nr:hypothetical protein [Streptomyces albidoflavus]RZF02826.1 hypothetical protein C0R05_31930 [Streptomyces albidoflavus]